MGKVTKEYIQAMDAYDKLYKVDKLIFVMNQLDVLNKYSDVVTLTNVQTQISQLLKDMTQLSLYQDRKEIYK